MEHVANYPVIRKLGEGATSEVFLCQDPFRGREVAVKRIFPEALRDPMRGRVFRKLFFTEASLAGKLEHPHIAQIFDAGIGEDSGYIVMEYVPGGTMERFCAPESLLPVEQVLEIAFKCARALAFAHARGVTHRDIKPGNILYATEPTDVRIGDFGLAVNMGSETTQVTGVGSPAYMSPEQIRDEVVDHRTDLYSLGVVMYQMLSGTLPYRGGNKFSIIFQITQYEPPPPSSHRRGVTESLDRVVRRAMQKDAAQRYQSGDELAEDLIEVLRAGTGEQRRGELGDADKFAALRNMRFFSAFADPELWEVIALGSWERVPAGAPMVRRRRARRLLLRGGRGRDARQQEQEAAQRCSVRANASARWPTSRLRQPRARRHRHGGARLAHPARARWRPRAGHRPPAAASSTAPSSASWSSGSISRTPVSPRDKTGRGEQPRVPQARALGRGRVDGLRALAPWFACRAASSTARISAYLRVARARRSERLRRARAHARGPASHDRARFGWRRDNYIGATPQIDSWRDLVGVLPSMAARAAARARPKERLRRRNPGALEVLEGHEPKPSLLHGDLWAANAGFSRRGRCSSIRRCTTAIARPISR